MLLNRSKLQNVGNTIFTEMSQLSLKHNAINLGQGFPDFPINNQLIGLVNTAMKAGHNQYAHSNGFPILRERISEKIAYLYNTSIEKIEATRSRFFNYTICDTVS